MDNATRTQELFELKTGLYRPPPRGMAKDLLSGFTGLPPFTVQTVEMMRRDPQVKLGMAIKTAPLLKPRITLKGDPAQQRFVAEQFSAMFTSMGPRILSALAYSRAAMEMVYKRDEKTGLIGYSRAKPLYPSDIKVLTEQGRLWGIKVKTSNAAESGESPQNVQPQQRAEDVILHGMKCFLYVHRREFGSWDGSSELEAAYPPWMEKVDRGGAVAMRKLWHYKCAFNGGTTYHPPGTTPDPADATRRIPNRDIARQAAEYAQSGAEWVFENGRDANGNRLWEHIPASVNGSGEPMLAYCDKLDTEILRGLEIPDDVISQTSGTGSFAGRTIPLMAFFTSQNVILQAILRELKEQVLDPLVRLNFGHIDYEFAKVEINIDELVPEPPSQENKTEQPVEAQANGQASQPAKPPVRMSIHFDEATRMTVVCL